ncbi:mandelate racemase/muconate lactonizing enzyme family protein [Leucobacter sp. M11]|uniref:mandelate racemase/muconate lactonizing enzyme family protein n=1 Tax=Leucobacter sp. M11 TaxID=2993565 RepID=UPI002D7FBE2A|nr:dipeptide epimerase [Leucobacter sp. M11]MEB4613478.1 dipeptide epimerase [Leucobacter sp. M11]
MRITSAEISVLEVPLKVPFIVAYARYDAMPTVILTLRTDTGLVGYGEAVPDEHVTGESIASVVAALRDQLLPALWDTDPTDINAVHAAMNRALLGNGAAKAALDIACYDLFGKHAGLPVYALLGGRKPEPPMIAKVLSILPPAELAEQATAAVAQGFTHLKMKLGDPALDVERVRQVRAAVGPAVGIRVDVNQGWTDVATSRRMIAAIEPFGIDWVEQPFLAEHLAGFRQLRPHTAIPLMADEGVITSAHVAQLVRDESVDMVNLKLMKSGGILPCNRLATQAALGGITAQIGSMLETSISSAAGYHLALAHPNIVSTELSGPVAFLTEPGNLRFPLPFVDITNRPGLGVDVDVDILASLTLHTQELSRP